MGMSPFLTHTNPPVAGHARMKIVWIEAMAKFWQMAITEFGHRGDVVFLEDDLIVAKDFFLAALHAAHFKNSMSFCDDHPCSRVRRVDVFALGGWGGENMINSESWTFAWKTIDAFPTMAYGFNFEFWSSQLLRLMPVLLHSKNPDWALALGHVLSLHRNASGAAHSEIEILQSTLSRVWHTGRKSAVGSRHKVHDRPPWQDAILLGGGSEGQDRNHNPEPHVLPGRRNFFGFLCRPHRRCRAESEHLYPYSKRYVAGFRVQDAARAK